jgi:hypothetical protein
MSNLCHQLDFGARLLGAVTCRRVDLHDEIFSVHDAAGPTEFTRLCGFSFAAVGNTMPPLTTSSFSMLITTTRSAKGFSFIRDSPPMYYELLFHLLALFFVEC